MYVMGMEWVLNIYIYIYLFIYVFYLFIFFYLFIHTYVRRSKLLICGNAMASLHKAPYRYTQSQLVFHQLQHPAPASSQQHPATPSSTQQRPASSIQPHGKKRGLQRHPMHQQHPAAPSSTQQHPAAPSSTQQPAAPSRGMGRDRLSKLRIPASVSLDCGMLEATDECK